MGASDYRTRIARGMAAATLERLGFTDVQYLAGGFRAWATGGHSIYNTHGELTVKDLERSEA